MSITTSVYGGQRYRVNDGQGSVWLRFSNDLLLMTDVDSSFSHLFSSSICGTISELLGKEETPC